jgi:bis(5'-adenosyl)-triphosphatase
MPRKRTDFGGDNDKVYPALEKHEQHLASAFKGEDQPQTLNGITEWRVPKDDDRKPRSGEEMEKEARWLMSLFV